MPSLTCTNLFFCFTKKVTLCPHRHNFLSFIITLHNENHRIEKRERYEEKSESRLTSLRHIIINYLLLIVNTVMMPYHIVCLARKKIHVEDNVLWWFLFFTSRTFSISRKNSLKRHYRQNNNLTLPRYRWANGQRTFAYCRAKMHNTSSKDMRHGKPCHLKHNFKKYF